MDRVRQLRILLLASVVGLACGMASAQHISAADSNAWVRAGYRGSSSCVGCHERFYKLWAPSHHGKAMQPFTPTFAKTELAPQTNDVKVGDYTYRAHIAGDLAYVSEQGPGGAKRYPILHAMGGKNVYFFLTPMDKGKLQVLPVAFDVNTREWYDTTGSMVRHAHVGDEALHWTERPLTFNTACFNCHVSQLSKNYDLESDSYNTVWAEPGINCETCHGPASEHVESYEAAALTGKKPVRLGLISTHDLTAEQRDVTCGPCHAKMRPITSSYEPGELYFNHYDMVTLEDEDFYPDGRDLGENYTWTLWHMNPCAKSGKMECIHCHTSSGRYRFRFDDDRANGACLPCHQARVDAATAHTHHKANSKGNRCISCHMPMTTFARMKRSDHSLLPPTPKATLAYKSPNACNICHEKKTAEWADKHVTKWHGETYQEPALARAALISAARKRDFSRLPDMLAYLAKPDHEPIVATSLVRLLHTTEDERIWPVLRDTLSKTSFPLLRAAIARSLGGNLAEQKTVQVLLKATDDPFRLVRIRAAAALARYPRETLSKPERESLAAATAEFKASLEVWLDDWSSHYNLGNYHVDRGDQRAALTSYMTASRLQSNSVPPLVNAAMVHARLGQNERSVTLLRQALAVDPNSPEANFNLGLALAESGDRAGAETHLRAAVKRDPRLAAAAYNLAVLVAQRNPEEAIAFSRQATVADPAQPKYGYTLGFYLRQAGRLQEAARVLDDVVKLHAGYLDAAMLLGATYEDLRDRRRAIQVYRKLWRNPAAPEPLRQQAANRLRVLEP